MVIGVLTLDLYVRHSQSLKQKRRVVKSLKDRLRARYNVSVSEVDFHDDKKRARIGVAAIGVDAGYVQGALEEVKLAVTLEPMAELGRSEIEFY